MPRDLNLQCILETLKHFKSLAKFLNKQCVGETISSPSCQLCLTLGGEKMASLVPHLHVFDYYRGEHFLLLFVSCWYFSF